MISYFMTGVFWLAMAKIVWINVLLSGDNAVVIALAARNLSPDRQKPAIIFGSLGAIGLRIVLIFFAVALLALPFLKLIGSALLVWIGVQLLTGDDEDKKIDPAHNLFAAIRTILVADLVMSIDNVLAIAAVAETAPESSRMPLLVIGLGLTIPLIMFGSTMLLKLMERFPLIVTAGAGLLGFVAGEMAASDPILARFGVGEGWVPYALGAFLAVVVIVLGKFLSRRRRH